MTEIPEGHWDAPNGWSLEDATTALTGPNPNWGKLWTDGATVSDPDGDFLHDVAALFEEVAGQQGFALTTENIDDTCLGLTIKDEKTLTQFLVQHRGIYNFQICDGNPIRLRRRLVNSDLTIDALIREQDCIGGEDRPKVQFTRIDPAALPGRVEIQYSDPDRSLAINTQIAHHPAAPINAPTLTIAIDFTIEAQQARDLAYDALYRIWGQPLSFTLEHRNLRLEPGDTFELTARSGIFIGLVEHSIITPQRTNLLRATALLTARGLSVAPGRITPKAPGNDNFANAFTLIPDAPQTANNRYATAEAGESDHAGNTPVRSLWWTYTPYAGAETVTVSTGGSSFDTVIGIYELDEYGTLTEVASDDNGGDSGTSLVTFLAEAGLTYLVAVDGKDGAYGDITITLTAVPVT